MIFIDWESFVLSENIKIEIEKKDGEVFVFDSLVKDLKSFSICIKDKEYRKSIWDEENDKNK